MKSRVSLHARGKGEIGEGTMGLWGTRGSIGEVESCKVRAQGQQ